MSLVEKTHNGLPVVTLHHPSGASAMIFVYAAHLASWTTSDGEQQLFLSSAADYAHGKAIRGGVPVCWPQFAERGAYGKHGFARTSSKWRIVRTSTEPHPCVVLGLSSDEETLASFPFPFELRYSVTLDGPSSVSVSLTVINTGADTLEFTTALHTYFSVDDVSKIKARSSLRCAALPFPRSLLPLLSFHPIAPSRTHLLPASPPLLNPLSPSNS